MRLDTLKLKNQTWSAISNQTINVDDHIRVLDVEGVKLVVEKNRLIIKKEIYDEIFLN